MSDTFNDGDPIDATLLQKLKTDVAKATALAGAKVSAGSNVNIGDLANQSAADITIPKFYGGKTSTVTVSNGKRATFKIDYAAAGFSGKPSAITMTAISKSGLADLKEPSIISGTVSNTGAEGQIWGSGDTKKITIFFIAVEN
jgi:ligand-binding sensor protein